MSAITPPAADVASLPAGDRRPPPRWAAWGLWLVIFAAWLLLRAETLALPPYEDQAVGLWTEADFLAESNFDYLALRYEQSHFMSPGSGVRSYMISVLPTVVAVLMRVAPSPRASFVAAHVLTIAAASGCCVLLWRMARGWLGDAAALALAAVLALTPLLAVQAELVGMDVPLTLMVLWSAALVHRGRWTAASWVGLGAFFMKATGALVTVSLLACLAGWWWSHRTLGLELDRRAVRRAFLLNLGFLALETALVRWGDTSREVRLLIEWPDCLKLPAAWNWSPDVLAALSVVAAIVAVQLALAWRRTGDSGWTRTAGRRLARVVYDQLRERPAAVLSWCILAGLVAACSRYIFIPRYFTCGAALTLVALAGLRPLHSVLARRLATAALLTWAALNYANADGRWYPSIERAAAEDFARNARLHARSCPFTERSREYLPDLKANVALMSWLEREHGGEPVLLPLPYLYYATKPRLGYVSRQLQAYDAGDFAVALAAFTTRAEPLADGGWRTPLLVWTGASRLTLPPLEAGQKPLYDDGLRPPVKVYRRAVGQQTADRQQLTDWFLEHTRSAAFAQFHTRVNRENIGTWTMTLLPELFTRQRYLAESLMISQLFLATEPNATDQPTVESYPELADDSPAQDAIRRLAQTLRRGGFAAGHGLAEGLLADRVLAEGGDPSVELTPAARAAALYALALCEAARGNLPAAQARAQELHAAGEFPLDSQLLLAQLAWQAGDLTGAADAVRLAEAQLPRAAACDFWLGLIAGRQGEAEAARQHVLALVRSLPQLVGPEQAAKRVPADE